MTAMTKDEVLHLADLARIGVHEHEAEQFTKEIDGIISYVSEVSAVAAEADMNQVGAVYNVLRPDVVTNEPGSFTDVALQAMPETDGRYMRVKKILANTDE